MPSRYMTLSTAGRRLVVMDAMALRGDVVVGENFLACGVSNKKQLADATASSNTAPMPIRQWYHWRIGMGAVLLLAVASASCFLLLTPQARKFSPTTTSPRKAIASITTNLRPAVLNVMYLLGMLLMGGFVAVYNFLGFHLVEEPFNLPVSVVSLLFLAYLMGTVTSPWAGAMATKYRPSRVLMVLTLIMIIGVLLTLVPN